MSSRVAPLAFVAVTICGLGLAASGFHTSASSAPRSPAPSQPEDPGAGEAVSAYFPLDPVSSDFVMVREPGIDEFDHPSTKAIPIEAWRHEDTQTLLFVTSNGQLAAVPDAPRWKLATAAFGDSFQCVRYLTRTGTAWLMDEGGWVLLEETDENMYVGDYEVVIIPGVQDVDVLRMDKLTGESWYLAASTWVKVTGGEEWRQWVEEGEGN